MDYLAILKEKYLNYNFHTVSILGTSIYAMSINGCSMLVCSFDSNDFFVDLISVDENSRLCGIGSELLEMAEHIATFYGFSEVNILCDSNSFVYDWYVKNGYNKHSIYGDDFPTWMYIKKYI